MIHARAHMTVKRGQWPIRNARGVSMLDRIEVDVIEVAPEVVLVSDPVFPEATLPESTFPFRDPRGTPPFPRWHSHRECRFHIRPAHRVVHVAGRQRPEAVQVIRQHDDGIHDEWARDARSPKGLTQCIDVLRQERPPPLGDGDREEIRASGHPTAAIFRHDGKIARMPPSRHRKHPRPAIRKPGVVGWASAHHCDTSKMKNDDRNGTRLRSLPRDSIGRVVG